MVDNNASARPYNLSMASCDLDLRLREAQSGSFHVDHLHQYWFIHFQNIVLMILLTDEQTNALMDEWTG